MSITKAEKCLAITSAASWLLLHPGSTPFCKKGAELAVLGVLLTNMAIHDREVDEIYRGGLSALSAALSRIAKVYGWEVSGDPKESSPS